MREDEAQLEELIKKFNAQAKRIEDQAETIKSYRELVIDQNKTIKELRDDARANKEVSSKDKTLDP